jgi:hypothetical protein
MAAGESRAGYVTFLFSAFVVPCVHDCESIDGTATPTHTLRRAATIDGHGAASGILLRSSYVPPFCFLQENHSVFCFVCEREDLRWPVGLAPII